MNSKFIMRIKDKSTERQYLLARSKEINTISIGIWVLRLVIMLFGIIMVNVINHIPFTISQ